jgi:hypothetical protein
MARFHFMIFRSLHFRYEGLDPALRKKFLREKKEGALYGDRDTFACSEMRIVAPLQPFARKMIHPAISMLLFESELRY